MKVLVVGSGGREHAIIKKLNQSKHKPDIVCFGTSINPGILKLAEIHVFDITNMDLFNEKIMEIGYVNWAIIGPEAPLEKGVVDLLEECDISCIGPRQAYAKIETSKIFCRDLLEKNLTEYDLNPIFMSATDLDNIIIFALENYENFVIKEDGLCGGKGVLVIGDHFKDTSEGIEICKELFNSGKQFILESFLDGDEFSLITLTDGRNFAHMPPVQDYKRAFEGDTGSNTGGMGCLTMENNTLPFLTQEDINFAKTVNEKVIQTLNEKVEGNSEYKGVLYGSFIKTQDGKIKVIEYNSRFGDPEVINLLSLLETDFFEVCQNIINGNLQDNLKFSKQAIVCKYLVPEGYPNAPLTNFDIYFDKDFNHDNIICASIEHVDDHFYPLGSRTLACVCQGDNLIEAARKVDEILSKIHGRVYFRQDIGYKYSSRYQSSGVDIDKGNKVVKKIQQYVEDTYNDNVLNKFGDFNGIFDLKDTDRALVASTDGVGTKVILVKEFLGLQGFEVLGQDLVNHCINDILTSGAEPLFFLDYFASGNIDQEVVSTFVKGISKACVKHDCVLMGGETAEMTDTYVHDKEDLVGTIVGHVEKSKILSKGMVKKGDIVIGLPSDGLHTNGYTLVRTIVDGLTADEIPENIRDKLVKPHRCYLNDIKLLKDYKIHGLCHVTGGGLVDNPPRVLPDDLSLELDLKSWPIDDLFHWIAETGRVPWSEMYKVFNCGIGMLIFVDPEDYEKINTTVYKRIEHYKVGRVISGNSEVVFTSLNNQDHIYEAV